MTDPVEAYLQHLAAERRLSPHTVKNYRLDLQQLQGFAAGRALADLNVSDIRNSKVPDIIAELRQFGIAAQVHDPLGDPAEAQHEYGITLAPLAELVDLDVLILAVSHQAYLAQPADLLRRVKDGGVVIDVKSVLDPRSMERGLRYWSL